MNLNQKLPGWVFVVTIFFASLVIVLITRNAILIARDIDNISTAITTQLLQNIPTLRISLRISKAITRLSQILRLGDFKGWKKYRNEKYGFEVEYDSELFYEIYNSPIVRTDEKWGFVEDYAHIERIRDPRLSQETDFCLREYYGGYGQGDPQFSIAFYDISNVDEERGCTDTYFAIIVKDRVGVGNRMVDAFNPRFLKCVPFKNSLDLVDEEIWYETFIGVADICDHPLYVFRFVNSGLSKAMVDKIFSTFKFIK